MKRSRNILSGVAELRPPALSRDAQPGGRSSAPPLRMSQLALCLGLGGLFVTMAAAADPSCFSCHDDQAAEFSASAHAQAGLSCVDCHGGNPAVADEEAHATDNFRRAANKQEIATACATCHSDVRKMNPYGLPTDQLERYKTSRHGEQLFGKNDQQVATCTDCHGVHAILKPDAPESTVHPVNIPTTCGRCHADAVLMDQYKLPSNVVAEYRTSVHATLLFEQGDLSAPTCVTCHGNHGAMPPGTVEVGQVCGKCHGRQRELFEKSPHAELAAAGMFSECVSCHGNHAIQPAAIELFASACVTCHAQDESQLNRRDSLVGLIRGEKDKYRLVEDRVHQATVQGFATDDEQLLLQEIKTQVTQLEALQHTLSTELLAPVAARSDELVRQVNDGLDRVAQVERWKRRALLPIWIFLMVMAGLFAAKRKEVEKPA